MPGAEQFNDLLAMATRGSKGPTNVVRITPDATGKLWVSIKGAAYVPFATAIGLPPGGYSFEQETLALAQLFMADKAINRVHGSDLIPSWEVSVPGANPPIVDPTFPGGVLQFPAAASQLALNPVTPGSSTYNPILGAFGSQGTAWFARVRFLINAQAFTAATSVIFLSLDGSGVGGGGATHLIQLLSVGSTDPRQTYIRLRSAASGPTDFSTGPDGILGDATSLLPINQMTTATIYFDGINLRWMFRDQFNDSNKLDALTGQLDSFPTGDACAVTVQSTDTTIGANFKVDAVAIAYQASQENK